MSPAIQIVVDDEQVVKALRGAARDVEQRTKEIGERAAKRTVLRRARSLSPRFARSSMAIRRSGGRVALTTTARGRERAIVGIANFGGTIRAPIEPKAAKALMLRGGGFTARVSGPRQIKGLHWMERSVEREGRAYLNATRNGVADWLQRYVRGQRALSRIA
jgi:hypothetical protein